MTLNEQIAATNALIVRLADVVDGVPHMVVLNALLSMVHTTGVNFPCCTAIAARKTVEIGLRLEARSKGYLAPQGAYTTH